MLLMKQVIVLNMLKFPLPYQSSWKVKFHPACVDATLISRDVKLIGESELWPLSTRIGKYRVVNCFYSTSIPATNLRNGLRGNHPEKKRYLRRSLKNMPCNWWILWLTYLSSHSWSLTYFVTQFLGGTVIWERLPLDNLNFIHFPRDWFKILFKEHTVIPLFLAYIFGPKNSLTKSFI